MINFAYGKKKLMSFFGYLVTFVNNLIRRFLIRIGLDSGELANSDYLKDSLNTFNRIGFLKKAILLFMPGGSSSGKAYSILPEDGSGDFTFTRASGGTYIDKNGQVQEVSMIGAELVQNGDFSELGVDELGGTYLGWSGTNWVVGTNQLNHYAEYNTNTISRSLTGLVIGKTYKLTVDYQVLSAVSQIRLSLDYSTAFSGSSEAYITESGSHIYYLTAQATSGSITFEGSGLITIDNILLKRVDPNNRWSLGSTCLIKENSISIISDGVYQFVSQNNVLTIGKQYILQYSISEQTSGGISLEAPFIELSSSVGIHEVNFIATVVQLSIKRNSGITDISIDNISVKEIITDGLPRYDFGGSNFNIPVKSQELALDGDFKSSSNWTKYGKNVTFPSGFCYIDCSGGGSGIYQTITGITGKTVVVTVEVLAFFDGLCRLHFGGDSQNLAFASGLQSFTFENVDSDVFTIGIDNIGKVNLSNISIKTIDGYTTNDKPALLLEPQSTNLMTYSEDYSSWTNSGGATTITPHLSPFGSLTASLLTSTIGVNDYISKTVVGTAINTKYCVSFYVKDNGLDEIQGNFYVYGGTPSQPRWKFITSTETLDVVGSVNLLSSGFYKLSNGWYRLYFVIDTLDNTSLMLQWNRNMYVSPIANLSAIFFGCQCEALPYATSYIPTTSATVTRIKDSCTDAGSQALFSSINSEGCLFIELKTFQAIPSSNFTIGLSNGTEVNDIVIKVRDNGQIWGLSRVGGVTQSYLYTSDLVLNEFNNVLFRWKENDFSFWINGVKKGEDLIGSVPIINTLYRLDFSRGDAISESFYGKVKQLAVLPYLSDAECIKLTT